MPWPPPPTQFLAILLLTVLAACHSGSSAASSSSSTTTERRNLTVTTEPRPSTTADPQAADKAAIRKVAEDWNSAVTRLGAAPNPDDPALRRYLTGQLLLNYRALWEQRQRDRIVARPVIHSRRMYRIDGIAISGSVALIRECVVDDDLLVGPENQVLNDDVESAEMVTTAMRAGPTWKLSARAAKRMKGIAGCALQR